MTRTLRTLLLAAVAATLAAAPLAAQVAVGPTAPRGWIGVFYDVMTSQEGGRLRTVSQVTDVMEGSPAAGAGIRPGDILISINGRNWEEQFDKGTPPIRPGEALRLVLERDGRRREVRLVAGTRPLEQEAKRKLEVTVMPDSIVDRLYLAMDSLRIRIMEDEGLRYRISELQVAADSVIRDLTRDRVVRMRRPAPGQTVTITPFEPPAPAESPGAAARVPSPFGVWVFRTPSGDSLRVVGETGIPFSWSSGERPAETFDFHPTVPYVLGENRAAGAEVVEVRPELAGYFGVDGGVLVVDVAVGTPAARAGLQPGDVLTRVGDASLRSIADLRRALARADDELPLTLIRKGRAVQVVLKR